MLSDKFKRRDASHYTSDELGVGKRCLGFVQGYNGDPFLVTLFNEVMLVLYRALASREEGFCVDYTGHEVSDYEIVNGSTGETETIPRLSATVCSPHPLASNPDRVKAFNYPPIPLLKFVSASENGYNFVAAFKLFLTKEAETFGNNAPVKRFFSDCSETILSGLLHVYNHEFSFDYLTRMVQLLFSKIPFPSGKTLVNWCFPHAMAAVSRWAQYDLKPPDKKVPMTKSQRATHKRFLQRFHEFLTIVKSFPLLVQWTKVSKLRETNPFSVHSRRMF